MKTSKTLIIFLLQLFVCSIAFATTNLDADGNGAIDKEFGGTNIAVWETHFVDASESDQGATASGSGETIYDVMQDVGTTKSATIVFRHTGVSSTTTYTLDTSIDASTYPNLYFKFEPGAVLNRTTGDEVLTAYSPENMIVGNEQAITSLAMIAFSNPGIVYSEWWGAIGDGSNNDTNPIQYAINCLNTAKGGSIQLLGKVYAVGNLELKSYVTIIGIQHNGSSSHLAGVSVNNKTTLLANTSGYVIGSGVSTITDPCIKNINFVGLGSGTAVKGLYLDDCDRGIFKYLSFDNFADQAILIDEGVANEFHFVFAVNCLLNTTRSSKIGVIEIGGAATDNYISNCESTPSLSALTDANLYICAWKFSSPSGSNNFVTNCIGEYADVGFYVASHWNRFVGCRSDLNYGHGFEIDNASQNQFSGCLALRNSQDNDNTYDGFNIVSPSNTNVFNGCISSSLGSDAWQQRYGFYDALASNSQENIYIGCHGTGNQTGLYSFADAVYSPGFSSYRIGPYDPTDNDATPSVEGKSFLRLNYSSNTTITDFDDGAPGQILDILKTSGAGTVTIQDGTNIMTNTGANKNMTNDIVYRFRMLNNIWYETE